jgi:hypothetical protein
MNDGGNVPLEESFSRNWTRVLEALSIALGTLIGGLVSFLIGKIDSQIKVVQEMTLASHIYQNITETVSGLIIDNDYYLPWLVGETIGVVLLLFGLFILFWIVKSENRRKTFYILTILVVVIWFVFSFETLTYSTLAARNALDIPTLNVSQSERMQIDSAFVSLDSFRPFVVYYDSGIRLLLSVFLMYFSSFIALQDFSRSSRRRQIGYSAIGILFWIAGVFFFFHPFVEVRFNYSGSFAIWKGRINVYGRPWWDYLVLLLMGSISIILLGYSCLVGMLKKDYTFRRRAHKH